jgi:hypothetical protein
VPTKQGLPGIIRAMTIRNQIQSLPLMGLILGLVVLFVLVACDSHKFAGKQEGVNFPGTPLTYRPPEGFVMMAKDEISIYPPRPIVYFRLPRSASDESNRLPRISLEQLPIGEGGVDLDRYMKKRLIPIPLVTTLANPSEISIDGNRAVEYGVLSPVFDGPGPRVGYEIDFEHGGLIYDCQMTADPDNYKQYVSIFEDFCSTLRFGK